MDNESNKRVRPFRNAGNFQPERSWKQRVTHFLRNLPTKFILFLVQYFANSCSYPYKAPLIREREYCSTYLTWNLKNFQVLIFARSNQDDFVMRMRDAML